MASRKINPELSALYESGTPVYSISRLDTINHCMYEAYKTYIAKERGADSIYSLLGTRVHDTLEAIINGKATADDLLPAMLSELEDAEMVYSLSFPKGKDGDDIIRKNWVADMTHFCTNYKKPSGKFKTEDFFLYKSPKGRYLQGYIDLQKIDDSGSIDVFDYKTSTIYSKGEIKEHGRQLVVYGMALKQRGYDVKSVNWIFLKYANITFLGKKTSKSKNKTEITKTIERRKIASEMAKYVESDLLESGYDELDTEMILDDFKKSGDFSLLPPEIAGNYTVSDCVMNYPLNEETEAECNAYIDDTIDMWEAMSGAEDDYPPLQFVTTTKTGKEKQDTFYCVWLCDHFKTCKYIKEFFDSRKEEEEGDII